MASQVIIRAVARTVAVIVGTTVSYILYDHFRSKRIAVLGRRGVGKTHLIQFLSTGSIPISYRQGIGRKKVPGRRLQLKDLNLKLNDMQDIGGNDYGLWKEELNKADFVFYLLRADQLIAHEAEVEASVRQDLRHIGEWLEQHQAPPKVVIVGTHCDLDPEYNNLTSDTYGDFYDYFCQLPIVTELVAMAGGRRNVHIILGSMKDTEQTEDIVYRIFKEVEE